MNETLVNIVCFFTSIISFYFIFPKIKVLVIKAVAYYRTLMRIRKVSGTERYYDDDSNTAESESIGLSQKGPNFGANQFFNRIIELTGTELVEEMQSLLLKAGMRKENAMEEFMIAKVNCGIALFFIVFVIILSYEIDIPILVTILISLVIAVIGGHELTNMQLEMMAEKRREAIENGVPDLIDLLVICTESGLDLNKAIRRIAREMRTSNPTLADELSLTSIELEMIPDHRQVFQNLENRTNCLPIRTLSKTFSQSIEYGSSLAVSLRDLAVESRQKRMLDAEAKAAAAPTLLTLPMMFFIMPCLFIVMLGPVIAGMISSFSGGS